MKRSLRIAALAWAVPFAIGAAQAQLASSQVSGGGSSAKSDKDSSSAIAKISQFKPIIIQNIRPTDTRGINVFEAPKDNGVAYTGFKLDWGTGFQQEFQGLQHSNLATAVVVGGVNTNQLMTIGKGFNTATANLYLNAQVAQGIRLSMTSYLSARHHNESWVKDGYALIDASPIDLPIFNKIMKYTTIKVGHFEINYGDQHFRRSDNGQAFFNPFVGNLMTDAFTTEIGGEVYVRNNGYMGMLSITGGEIGGSVVSPASRAPSFIGKLGFDKQLTQNLRVRLTGSGYHKDKSASNTLFTGDRGGSHYFLVMENTAATTTANAWSGELRPSFGRRVNAFMVNPFVKFHGLELLGTAETATGKSATETRYHTWRQWAGETVYRFGENEKFFGAYRYNVVSGRLAMTMPGDVNANRFQTSAGWYLNPMMLIKAEYMRQRYYGFPTNDIRYGGRIHGFMVETALSF
ncbi:MAG TPA: hypothetical protein VF483_07805 [Gemmatimonadaceae bacterium]